jgi:hypothetical protein
LVIYVVKLLEAFRQGVAVEPISKLFYSHCHVMFLCEAAVFFLIAFDHRWKP